MQQGIVAKKNDEKHYGFIKVEGREKDLFFHSSDLANVTFDELREGDTVSFEVGKSPDGRENAVKVNKV